MKFNFLGVALLSSLLACPELSKQEERKLKNIWQKLLQNYGYPPKKARPPEVCIDNSAFKKIPRGTMLRSVYDRKTHQIYLRKWDLEALKHELAHAYLELRYPSLPYSLSEKLSRCIYEPYEPQKEMPPSLRKFLEENPTSYCISRKAAFYLLKLSQEEILKLLQ